MTLRFGEHLNNYEGSWARAKACRLLRAAAVSQVQPVSLQPLPDGLDERGSVGFGGTSKIMSVVYSSVDLHKGCKLECFIIANRSHS